MSQSISGGATRFGRPKIASSSCLCAQNKFPKCSEVPFTVPDRPLVHRLWAIGAGEGKSHERSSEHARSAVTGREKTLAKKLRIVLGEHAPDSMVLMKTKRQDHPWTVCCLREWLRPHSWSVRKR